MPWINLTLRKGALAKPVQHALMRELTHALMWWEKVPDTVRARQMMKGWIYEVDADADYLGGEVKGERPSYFTEVRIPAGRLDLLMKQGIQRDFTRIILDHEGLGDTSAEDARRVWITIVEIIAEDWSIGGHTDWLRSYTSALDDIRPGGTARSLRQHPKATRDDRQAMPFRARGGGVAASLADRFPRACHGAQAVGAHCISSKHDERAAPMKTGTLRQEVVSTTRHVTGYLAAGPHDGTPVMLVHGWPHIGLMWRHQIAALAAAGYRVLAPDLRGTGRSDTYDSLDAYAQRELVQDMIDLIDALGIGQAVWIGHDWGAIVVSNLARHHPDRCLAAGAISQPFNSLEKGLDALTPLLNRTTYPAGDFPYGQFDYMRFYHERFDDARRGFEADISATFRAILRKGAAKEPERPFQTAFVRSQGGWFGPDGRAAPDAPLKGSVIEAGDLHAYVEAFGRTGFFGIDALYMNDAENAAYFAEARPELNIPVLFVGGLHDHVCDSEHSNLAQPMRAACSRLDYVVIEGGHWLPQERPEECASAILGWLDRALPGHRGDGDRDKTT